MGYASYTLPDGREAGYAVEATCDEPGCDAAIDRGLAYLCGQMPGGDEYGCGGYFCPDHLELGGTRMAPDEAHPKGYAVSTCARCADPDCPECDGSGFLVEPDRGPGEMLGLLECGTCAGVGRVPKSDA